MRTIGAFIVLFGLWLLLSGLYKPLIIAFGVASSLVAVYVMRRMDRLDGDQGVIHLKPLASFGYFLWLLVEIAKANWTVTKIILSPKMPIRQHLFSIPNSQKTDLAQVIFANSITLTPGTISVETESTGFLIHALAFTPGDKAALADMDRRVTATEQAPAKGAAA